MSLMLVTGGAGFIGSHIVERLLSMGHDVRVLDNFSTGHRGNLEGFGGSLEIIEGDVRDLETVKRAADCADVVFHEAALASVPRSVDDPVASNEVNVLGTLNVLVSSRDAGVRRVIYASSSSIYGESPELPKREDMTPSPQSPYAVSKMAGEHYCRVFARIYDLDCVALRYFNVFGPRQDPHSQYAAVVPIFITALIEGKSPTIYGDGEQSRDFTHVKNVVDANVLAAGADRCSGEVLNAACGSTFTVNALFEKLKALIGSDVEPVYEPPRPGDVKHSFADIERAHRVIGFEPTVGFEEGLRLTVGWFRGSPLQGSGS